jgi:hypothetical protein
MNGNSTSDVNHVLALGYRRKKNESELEMRSNIGVECHYINTVHSFLLNSEWQTIANVVGESAMRQILNRPLFLLIQNGCFVQLAGTQISQLLFRPFESIVPIAQQNPLYQR